MRWRILSRGAIMQSTLHEPDVSFALPDAYVKPSLELIHGATTRLDELCNTILNFVRCNCIQNEPVQLPSRGGGKKDAVVKHPVEGKPWCSQQVQIRGFVSYIKRTGRRVAHGA